MYLPTFRHIPRDRFVLLLHRRTAMPTAPDQIQTEMHNLRAWLCDLDREGALAGGSALEAEARLVGTTTGTPRLAGLVVIEATSWEHATTWARRLPASVPGFAVEVRRVAAGGPSCARPSLGLTFHHAALL